MHCVAGEACKITKMKERNIFVFRKNVGPHETTSFASPARGLEKAWKHISPKCFLVPSLYRSS